MNITDVLLAAIDNNEAEAKRLLGEMSGSERKQLLQAVERIEDWIADVEGWYEPLSADEVERRAVQRSRDPLLEHVRKEIEREREP